MLNYGLLTVIAEILEVANNTNLNKKKGVARCEAMDDSNPT